MKAVFLIFLVTAGLFADEHMDCAREAQFLARLSQMEKGNLPVPLEKETDRAETEIVNRKDGSTRVVFTEVNHGVIEQWISEYHPKLSGGFDVEEIYFHAGKEISRTKRVEPVAPIRIRDAMEEKSDALREAFEAKRKEEIRTRLVQKLLRILQSSDAEFDWAKRQVLLKVPSISEQDLDIFAISYVAVFSPRAHEHVQEGRTYFGYSTSQVRAHLRGEKRGLAHTISSGSDERYTQVIDGLNFLKENGFHEECSHRSLELSLGLKNDSPSYSLDSASVLD